MKRALLFMLFICAFAIPASAQDLSKEQVEKIVEDYIRANPKVIIDSVENFGQEQQQEQEQALLENVKKHHNWLYKNDNHPVIGAKNADVTMIEFFDYNCGYCKQAMGDMMTMLDRDKKLNMIMIELPILGESSVDAARWSLASRNQDLYMEYHIALMRHKGPMNEAVFKDYAKKVGMDVAQLEKDAKSSKINDLLDENLGMARTLGMTGTPAFIIGDEIIRGYVGLEGFEAAVVAARKK